jgi:hypothetical protein
MVPKAAGAFADFPDGSIGGPFLSLQGSVCGFRLSLYTEYPDRSKRFKLILGSSKWYTIRLVETAGREV